MLRVNTVDMTVLTKNTLSSHQSIMFTLSVRKPQLLTILVLKFEQIQFLPDGAFCSISSGSALFAQSCTSEYIW